MIITQEQLIREIAETENINLADLRRIFAGLEGLIFRYLSMATPSESLTVKPLKGLSVECKYVPERHLHTYQELHCRERIWAKPKITRYYNRKLNEGGFSWT